MTGHRARRRFGQNFLHDGAILARMHAAIDPRPGQAILEIGPGQGALTEYLLKEGVELTAIELDRDLAAILENRFADRLRLIQADALQVDLQQLAPADARWRVVGNLPYNISTPLLFHLLRFREHITDMHFLLQREVVQRLAATPGTKAYGRLGIMTQYYCQVEPLFEVGPESFRPAPKVVSQVVRLRPRPSLAAVDLDMLDRLLRTAFSQRRKTLRKALQPLVNTATMDALGIDPGRRPDTLGIDEFIAMADAAGEPRD